MLALAGCALPDYMDAQPLPALGLEGPAPRDHIFGYLAQSWMAFDSTHDNHCALLFYYIRCSCYCLRHTPCRVDMGNVG